MANIDLIQFLKNLNNTFENIDFYDSKISVKIIKLHNILLNYMKEVKDKDIIFPFYIDFKSIPGKRGRVIMVEFNKNSFNIDKITEILKNKFESINYNIDKNKIIFQI